MPHRDRPVSEYVERDSESARGERRPATSASALERYNGQDQEPSHDREHRADAEREKVLRGQRCFARPPRPVCASVVAKRA